MQDLARHPLDEANAKLGAPADKKPPPIATPTDPDGARFLSNALPLPSTTMQRIPEADRRMRSLADIREAFMAFEDPSDDGAVVPTALRTQETQRETSNPRPSAQATMQSDGRGLHVQQAHVASVSAPDAEAAPVSIRLRPAPAAARSPFIDSLQASTAASRSPRKPASSQPFLLLFAGAIIAFAFGGMLFRFF